MPKSRNIYCGERDTHKAARLRKRVIRNGKVRNFRCSEAVIGERRFRVETGPLGARPQIR